MRDQSGTQHSMTLIAPPALAAVSVLLFVLLPSQAIALLTAWALGSLPIGILIGRCVLSEQ